MKRFFFLFGNGHFLNVVSTFTNVLKLDVENENVTPTLCSIVLINVEIHNADSMLFDVVLRCNVCINQNTTLRQRWNVCLVNLKNYFFWHYTSLFKMDPENSKNMSLQAFGVFIDLSKIKTLLNKSKCFISTLKLRSTRSINFRSRLLNLI